MRLPASAIPSHSGSISTTRRAHIHTPVPVSREANVQVNYPGSSVWRKHERSQERLLRPAWRLPALLTSVSSGLVLNQLIKNRKTQKAGAEKSSKCQSGLILNRSFYFMVRLHFKQHVRNVLVHMSCISIGQIINAI